MCGSSVSMSCRAANMILPPGFACANAVSGARRSSPIAAIVLMLVPSRSRAELVGRVRDGQSRRDEIVQRHPLIRCRPLLVDADVARAVLHAGDAVAPEAVAVAAVSE